MSKKIVIIQYGSDESVFPLLSLVIGFQKAYPGSLITWVGEPHLADLVRYNKRIQAFLDISQEFTLDVLQKVFNPDICVNVSLSPIAKQFASNVKASKTYGFDKNGPTSRNSEFVKNVLNRKILTRKTLLQLHYDLVELKWKGEGYGLNYYPRTKQTRKCGLFANNGNLQKDDCMRVSIPRKILRRFDVLNKFTNIVTDDLFMFHASIALRKHCTLIADLPYQMEFFGKGTLKPFIK